MDCQSNFKKRLFAPMMFVQQLYYGTCFVGPLVTVAHRAYCSLQLDDLMINSSGHVHSTFHDPESCLAVVKLPVEYQLDFSMFCDTSICVLHG